MGGTGSVGQPVDSQTTEGVTEPGKQERPWLGWAAFSS